MGDSSHTQAIRDANRHVYIYVKIFGDNTEAQVIDPNKFVKDEIRDLCLYLTTILGYGNYWLILDELDKVDEREKDKYAPLLHITRERHIKDYSFRTLNNGKGAGVPEKVISGSKYTVVKGLIDEAIKEELPLLELSKMENVLPRPKSKIWRVRTRIKFRDEIYPRNKSTMAIWIFPQDVKYRR